MQSQLASQPDDLFDEHHNFHFLTEMTLSLLFSNHEYIESVAVAV